jgi:hypothetical protein
MVCGCCMGTRCSMGSPWLHESYGCNYDKCQ